MANSTHIRLVCSGNIVEHLTYSKPQFYNYTRFPKRGRNKKQKRSISSRLKSTSTLRHLVNCNPELNIFLTLTFAENVKDLTKANYEFKKFIQRIVYLRKKIGIDTRLKYVCVVEFQKRGAVHYHIVWNMPKMDIKQIEQTWGFGFIWLTRCRAIRNIGAYFAKHGTKRENDVVESENLAGRKKFFCSKNLDRPVIIRDETEALAFLKRNIEAKGIQPFFEKLSVFQDLTVSIKQYKINNNEIEDRFFA